MDSSWSKKAPNFFSPSPSAAIRPGVEPVDLNVLFSTLYLYYRYMGCSLDVMHCGEEIAEWLCNYLKKDGFKLVKADDTGRDLDAHPKWGFMHRPGEKVGTYYCIKTSTLYCDKNLVASLCLFYNFTSLYLHIYLVPTWAIL